jgi:penicillin G amidase
LVTRVLAIAFGAVGLFILGYILYAAVSLRAAAQTQGTIRAGDITSPVRIVRDNRDIPHIYAANEHDLMFAQGYAEASDRLFQMDLLRRYVYGRLSEVLGTAVLSADENARIVDIKSISAAQTAALTPGEHTLLQAFSDGVNAAMRTQPLPPEFRLLFYKPEPWKPQDSIAAGMATVLDLIDPWTDVIRRERVAIAAAPIPNEDLYSITDPAYDVPLMPSKPAPIAALPARPEHPRNTVLQAVSERGPVGSNEWAIGAGRSADGHALLANDPHLRLSIPGVWYLLDLHAPSMHVAGASLAGTPGVILGHNENIAWGATNGTVTTESVYRDTLASARVRREIFHVRFGRDVSYDYYTTKHGFVASKDGKTAYAVNWNAVTQPVNPLRAFQQLDRAHSIADAIAALRSYPGPPQNFVIADRSGAVAYHLAGLIPNDPLWGLRVHPDSDGTYPFIPFDALPHVTASRDGIVFTANNRMYGAGYPHRLSPNFAAPYRAARIRQLLYGKGRLSVSDLASFQNDTFAIPERDIARATIAAINRKGLQRDAQLERYVNLLAHWDGRFDPQSRGAAIAWELRRSAAAALAQHITGSLQSAYQGSANTADVVLLMRVLRERPRGWWPHDDYDDLLIRSLRAAVQAYGTRMLEPWSEYGRVTVRHPLAGLGFTFLNGATFPGDGDSYGLHVQTDNHSQSFRAVWDVGNWDAGGISIPSGESGEPASGHYTDQSPAWIAERLEPLPFSDAAVRAASRATLTLTP